MAFNKVILMGRLTADPELRQTSGGISVTRFSIAVDRRFSKGDQGQQTADFINIVAWRQTAEFITKYFKKGSQILVCGQLQSNSWTDPKDNSKRYSVEVIADEVSFTGSARDNNASNNAGNQQYTPSAYGAPAFSSAESPKFEEVASDNDLPF